MALSEEWRQAFRELNEILDGQAYTDEVDCGMDKKDLKNVPFREIFAELVRRDVSDADLGRGLIQALQNHGVALSLFSPERDHAEMRRTLNASIALLNRWLDPNDTHIEPDTRTFLEPFRK